MPKLSKRAHSRVSEPPPAGQCILARRVLISSGPHWGILCKPKPVRLHTTITDPDPTWSGESRPAPVHVGGFSTNPDQCVSTPQSPIQIRFTFSDYDETGKNESPNSVTSRPKPARILRPICTRLPTVQGPIWTSKPRHTTGSFFKFKFFALSRWGCEQLGLESASSIYYTWMVPSFPKVKEGPESKGMPRRVWFLLLS